MALAIAIVVAVLAIGAPSAQAALDPPKLGKTVNVRPVSGQVFVDGDRLTEPRQIPVGSVVNTKAGAVRLTSARADSDETQSGRFSRGRFRVRQLDNGLTVARLIGSRKTFATCSGGRTIRQLRASVHGDFRTRGRYSSTTADGTVWLTKDTCTTTTTVVSRGQVEVDDFGRDKTTTVSAGERYKAGASS